MTAAIRRELPLLGVLAGVVAAVGIVMAGDWRPGLVLLGAVLLLAAGLRTLLPDAHLGMLVVRGRTLDCLLLAVPGGALIVLAQSLGSVR